MVRLFLALVNLHKFEYVAMLAFSKVLNLPNSIPLTLCFLCGQSFDCIDQFPSQSSKNVTKGTISRSRLTPLNTIGHVAITRVVLDGVELFDRPIVVLHPCNTLEGC
jgi:hypothetical protein